MKKSGTHAFVNQFLIGLLVTIGLGGSVGLGTVWMRYQISVTANTNRVLQAKIHEVERRIDETISLVETEQSPELLRQRNAELGLGLVPMDEKQLIRVATDPTELLLARNNRNLYDTDRAEPNSRIVLGQ
jgi:hypothetical protein